MLLRKKSLEQLTQMKLWKTLNSCMNIHSLKQKFSTWNAQSKIQKMFGMNSPLLIWITSSSLNKYFVESKSKNYFLLEKRKGNSMMCFGLKYTEDIAFKNWLNRKPERLNMWHPSDFQDLLKEPK